MTSLSPSASSLSSSDDVTSSGGLAGGQRTSPTNSVTSDLSSNQSSNPPDPSSAKLPLHCTVCSDAFRSPRLLHCLHTFCAPCLESLVILGGAETPCVSCPECHFITKLPVAGVSGLLVDFGMARMIAQTSNAGVGAGGGGVGPRTPRILCTACKGTENYVQAECFDCANYLCGTCVQAHQRMHCFNRHRVQPLNSTTTNNNYDTFSSKLGGLATCPSHPAERLEYFCNSCDMPICKECALKTHPKAEHDVAMIGEVFAREVAMLSQMRDHAQVRADELSEHRAGQSANNYHQSQVAIEDTFQFYVQILKERRDELMQQLDGAYEEKLMTAKMLHDRRRRLLNICVFLDRLLSFASEAEILACKHQIVQFTETALSMLGPVDLAIGACGEVQFVTNYQNIQSSVQSAYGCIQRKEIPNHNNNNNGVGRNYHRAIPSISGMGETSRNGSLSSSSVKGFSLAPGPPPSSNGHLGLNSVAASYDRPLTSSSSAIDSGLNGRLETMSNGSSSKQGSPTTHHQHHGLYSRNQNTNAGGVDFLDKWNGKWTSNEGASPTEPSSFFNLSSDTLIGEDAKAFAGMSPARQTIRRIKMPYVAKFGDFGTNDGQFSEPSGVAVNGNRDILVADTNNHRVQIFDCEGRFKSAFGECGKRDGQMLYPNRLAVARNGDVVVTERSPTHQIQVYNQYGIFLRKFGADILQHPRGITVDYRGRVIVVECKVMRVVIFEPNGRIFHKFSCSQQLEFPNGVATNDNEEIFISDNRAHCVKVFNYHGIYLRQIGGEGVTNFPIGVCITERGQVVVADNHNNFNLTIFRQDGTLLSAYESRVKHAQCFDVTLMDEGSVVLASKDYKVYVYRFGSGNGNMGTGMMNSYPVESENNNVMQMQQQQQQRPLSNMSLNMPPPPGYFSTMKSGNGGGGFGMMNMQNNMRSGLQQMMGDFQ